MADPVDFKVLVAGAAVRGATSALVKSYVDEVVVPFLRRGLSKKTEALLRTNLSKYLKFVENKTRYISSVARSSPFPFEDVYEPLTVTSEVDGFSSVISSYPRKVFEFSRCLAVTDDAGMGKSTLAKYIVRTAIAEGKNIPIFIELRRLRSGHSLLDTLCQELVGKSEGSESVELYSLFGAGGFIFIFDGFDEVEETLRGDLVSEINEMASRFQFCFFLLTSRPEYSISLFPEFSQVKISKLNKKQANSLIRRYDAGRGLARLLIPKVAQAGVSEFLGNPLLVTLLYRAFDHRNSVPPKRTSFFKQVYDALFQDHDLSKGDAFARRKKSGLDREDFHKLVRAIGFETFKSGRVSYAESEALAHIVQSMKRTEFKVDPKAVFDDLLKAVPLFVRDGVEVKWCHKAFQEYFASQYIHCDMGDLRVSALRRMFSSEEFQRYTEIFRFLGECDVLALRDSCIEPLLDEAREICPEGAPLELACLFDGVDIFYIGDLQGKVEFFEVEAMVQDALDINLDGRLTSSCINISHSVAVMGVLKNRGRRYLMLPAMDPANFSIKNLDANEMMESWHKAFGRQIFHVNPTISELISTAQKLGGSRELEFAAHLPVAQLSVYEQIKLERTERQAVKAANALEDF